MIPFVVVAPPVNTSDSSTIVSYIVYILIVVIGAIFATEYAAWRIGHKVKKFENKVKGYEKRLGPFLDIINKIDPKQIEALLKNISDLTATIKTSIAKPPVAMPEVPPVSEENRLRQFR